MITSICAWVISTPLSVLATQRWATRKHHIVYLGIMNYQTEISDIFALGSTLYELATGKAPYSELNELESDDPGHIKAWIRRQHKVVDAEIELRYKNQQFPDTSGHYCGDIILGCWRGQFGTAREALDMYLRMVNSSEQRNSLSYLMS